MTDLFTAAEMRALEGAAMASGQVTGLELMERAGRGVVEAVLARWPDLARTSHRAQVLCGPGNNGGDGFVVARLLRERGWQVDLYLYGDADRLPPHARANHDRWCEMGEVRPWPGPDRPHYPWACDLIVDALFGTGLSRPLSSEDGIGAMLPEWDLRHSPGRPRIVAVDVPSGLCSDSGRYLGEGEGLWADLTVTFHAPRQGHYLAEASRACGLVVAADIGLAPWQRNPAPTALAAPDPRVADKGDPFGGPTHKYSHGHALVLSGGAGRTGAARLAARGGLRIGAGLVTIGVPGAAQLEVAAQITAIMLTRAETPEDMARILQDRRINALCLGPGLGLDRARALVSVALDDRQRGVVLDADALTAFAGDPDDLFSRLHDRCVLTPHGGEFARLFPDLAEQLSAPARRGPAFSKVDAARAAAARAGCVVLFKGADTVIAAPDGRCRVNAAFYERAAPWLATAGAGDVLAGMIGGLLARGFDALRASETAARLHLDAAREFGPGLVAEDLPEVLPRVLAKLGRAS